MLLYPLATVLVSFGQKQSSYRDCIYYSIEHLGLKKHLHYYQTADTQLQYEVSHIVWSRHIENEQNDSPEDPGILLYMSRALVQHPMA